MMETQRALRTWTTVQTVAGLFLMASVLALAYFAFQSHSALCTFKQDLAVRAQTSRDLLEENPEADPIRFFGLTVPRDQIETNLRNQERSLESLEAVQWCDGP